MHYYYNLEEIPLPFWFGPNKEETLMRHFEEMGINNINGDWLWRQLHRSKYRETILDAFFSEYGKLNIEIRTAAVINEILWLRIVFSIFKSRAFENMKKKQKETISKIPELFNAKEHVFTFMYTK